MNPRIRASLGLPASGATSCVLLMLAALLWSSTDSVRAQTTVTAAPTVGIECWILLADDEFRQRLRGIESSSQMVPAAALATLIKETEQLGQIELLTRPTLLTKDREAARITLQTQVPVATPSDTPTATTRPIFLELRATPQLQNDGAILLELRMELEARSITPASPPNKGTLTAKALIDAGDAFIARVERSDQAALPNTMRVEGRDVLLLVAPRVLTSDSTR